MQQVSSNSSTISVVVNGERRDVTVDHRVTLLDLVRERYDLTGSKKAVTTDSVEPARCCSTAAVSTRASPWR